MTLLIVTLSQALPTAATLCAGVLSEDGRTVLQSVEAPLALLPTPAGTEIVAVVPASRLSWHRLALPRGALKGGMFQEGSAGRLRAVLDGLLEDRVLDDTSQLHFALEPQPRLNEPVWVAACDRAWLHAWLEALAQAGGLLTQLSHQGDTAGRMFYMVKVENARLTKMVVPGDRLDLDVTLKRLIRNMAFYTGVVSVNGEQVACADVLCDEDTR